MTRSLHDNLVVGYSVEAERARIVIRTEYRDRGEPFERTNARFDGVIGYFFHDNLGGILFDITEEPLENILRDYGADFDWGSRYGWPWVQAGWSDPHEHVASTGARAFRVHSSIGFDGFVIAQTLTIEPGEHASATDLPAKGR